MLFWRIYDIRPGAGFLDGFEEVEKVGRDMGVGTKFLSNIMGEEAGEGGTWKSALLKTYQNHFSGHFGIALVTNMNIIINVIALIFSAHGC